MNTAVVALILTAWVLVFLPAVFLPLVKAAEPSASRPERPPRPTPVPGEGRPSERDRGRPAA